MRLSLWKAKNCKKRLLTETNDRTTNSDDDDPEYLPQGQAGVVGVSGDPALLHEDSSDDKDDSSDESSEDESQTQSSRLSKNGSY